MREAFVILLDRVEYLNRELVIACEARAVAEARLAEIERQAKDAARTDPSEVIRLIEHMAAGKKIEAIKAYRALTGFPLKEAKDAIETPWRLHNPRGAQGRNR